MSNYADSALGSLGKEMNTDFTLKRRKMMRRLALNGLFVAMAVVLSALEHWIPITAVIPVPGVKLGLANIITLFILFYSDWTDAAIVSALRSLLAALAFGGMSSLMFSLAGAFLALPAMMLALRLYPKWVSIIGISICGAAAHNVGQLAVAAVVMRSEVVFGYLPILNASAIVMGTLTALVARVFFVAMERSGLAEIKVGQTEVRRIKEKA